MATREPDPTLRLDLALDGAEPAHDLAAGETPELSRVRRRL